MFYVSKITPILFLMALFNLFSSLFFDLFHESLTFFLSVSFGFIGFTLIGALYQIVPNSQNRKLSWPSLSYVVFFLLLLAFLNLYTLDGEDFSEYFFLAVLLGALHLTLNIKNRAPITVRFLIASTIYLVVSAFFLFLFFHGGAVSLQLAVHTLTVGAMLNAVYGVELAWIPMLLMETLNVRKAERLFIAKQITTPLFLIAFLLMDYRLVSVAFLMEMGVALYFIYLLYEVVKRRRMPTPMPGVVKFFFFALGLLPLGLGMGAFGAGRSEVLSHVLELHLALVVYGFTAFTIFGGMLHLMPRIVWNWKKESPYHSNLTVSDLLDEKSTAEFFERAVGLYALFFAIEVLVPPLHALSSIPYLILLVLLVQYLSKTIGVMIR